MKKAFYRAKRISSCEAHFIVRSAFTFLLLAAGCAGEKVQVRILESEFIYHAAPFPQCHASTIAETANGLVVAFFGGTHERHPDVCIYTSRQVDGRWSKPEKTADGAVDDTLRYPAWNPVLFPVGNRLCLYYKIGASPVEWRGMYRYSDDNGWSWSEARALPDGIIGPVKNKPVRLASGAILSPSSVEYTPDLWKAHIERSTDDAQTWAKIAIPSDSTVKVIQPTLLVYAGHRIQALLRSDQNRVMQSWSDDDGQSWSAIEPTELPNPNAGIDGITTGNGVQLLVGNPSESGNSWEDGRNKLKLYASLDGQQWVVIHTLEDEPQGEFSYPAIIQSATGIIHITYTYNRKRIKHVALKVEK